MAEGLKSHGRAVGEYLSGGHNLPPSCWDRVDWSPLSEGACAPLAPLVPPSLNMTQSVAENVWSLYTNEFQKVEKLNFSVKTLIQMGRNITTGKIYLRPLRWWALSAPTGGDSVKVSENFCASAVVPVAPPCTSLGYVGCCGVRKWLIIREPAGNLRELAAEVKVPCVSRRVVIGVFFIPEIRISRLAYLLYSESINSCCQIVDLHRCISLSEYLKTQSRNFAFS